MAKQTQHKKTQAILQVLAFAGILILLNVLANLQIGDTSLYAHLDLTEEKRFTLTPATNKLLSNVDDVVFIDVLLEGEFPAGFKRLQTAARDVLNDFRSQSSYIEYRFSDPSQGTAGEINARREELAKDGVLPLNLRVKKTDGTSEQLVYPYAMIYYKGRMAAVNLIENEIPGVPQEFILNNAIGLLEYKLANALQKLRNTQRPVIAFTTGHGELDKDHTADWEKSLRQYYDTGRINLDSAVSVSSAVSLLVVAKPERAFSDKDKFKIDQYVMNGGKLLWLIDPLKVSLDSLRGRKEYFPQEYDLQLDDLLFRYGIRINTNLVLDVQCTRIPLATGMAGNAAQLDYFRYPYHVVVTPRSQHPIVKSLAPLNLLYPASIDTTVRTKTPVQKTVILESSENSRYQFPPIAMDFEFLRYDLDPTKFDKGPQPLALLLEGEFPSLYENRVTQEMLAALQDLGQPFKTSSVPNRMIVVADGDIARNRVKPDGTATSPLGYNEFEKYQFANKDFLLNAVEYLIQEDGIMEARAKDVKLRLLDVTKAQAESTQWQLFNLGLPLLFLALFGIGFQWLRRRRYAR